MGSDDGRAVGSDISSSPLVYESNSIFVRADVNVFVWVCSSSTYLGMPCGSDGVDDDEEEEDEEEAEDGLPQLLLSSSIILRLM